MRGVVTVAVLAVAGVLFGGVFLTGVVRVRETANRAACQNHLRQAGWFALWDVVDASRVRPPQRGMPRPLGLPAGFEPSAEAAFPAATFAGSAPDVEQRLSFYAGLVAGLGKAPLAESIDRGKPWDGGPNADAARTLVPELVCPSVFAGVAAGEPAPAHYVANAGVGPDGARLPVTDQRAGLYRYDAATPVAAVADGLSHTLSLLETTESVGPWLRGGPATARSLDPGRRPLVGPGGPFGGSHPGGGNTIYADGSVRFLAAGVSPDVLAALMTASGGSAEKD